MNTSPIYIQRDGKSEGPFDCEQLYSMIEDGEIREDNLSQTEGMPGWRSIPETRIWSEAKLLNLVFGEALALVTGLGENKIDERHARTEIKQALMRKNCLIDFDTSDLLGTVLSVNRWLLKQCVEGNQKVSEYFPVQELVNFEPQRFPRDWPGVWTQAGGKIYEGRMVARKDDQVWLAISDFGYPFPPFSFDVAIWIRDVSIDEAEKLGMADLKRPIILPKNKPYKFFGI